VEKFPQAAAGKSVAACGVFAVDDNEPGIVFSPEIGNQLFYSFLAALADDISYKFSKMAPKINRVLLAVFALIVVLMLVKVIPSQTARYLIIAIMGAALAINGISGYRQSKWAGFFLMVFGTFLCLGTLMMI
jgi:hypothetical protein